MNETIHPRTWDQPLPDTIGRLASLLGSPHFPAGDRASLRRWSPGQPVPLAFYRLWLRHFEDDPPHESRIGTWMGIVWGIATLGPDSHSASRPLGQALADAGFSEERLERLLSAPDEIRIDMFISAVRYLAAKDAQFDWTEAATFLLTTDAGKRELINRRIAQQYYRHLPRN